MQLQGKGDFSFSFYSSSMLGPSSNLSMSIYIYIYIYIYFFCDALKCDPPPPHSLNWNYTALSQEHFGRGEKDLLRKGKAGMLKDDKE